MGGSFNGKQNPFIKFDLMRVFLEDDINVSKLGSLQKEAVFIAQETGYK